MKLVRAEIFIEWYFIMFNVHEILISKITLTFAHNSPFLLVKSSIVYVTLKRMKSATSLLDRQLVCNEQKCNILILKCLF